MTVAEMGDFGRPFRHSNFSMQEVLQKETWKENNIYVEEEEKEKRRILKKL